MPSNVKHTYSLIKLSSPPVTLLEEVRDWASLLSSHPFLSYSSLTSELIFIPAFIPSRKATRSEGLRENKQ